MLDIDPIYVAATLDNGSLNKLIDLRAPVAQGSASILYTVLTGDRKNAYQYSSVDPDTAERIRRWQEQRGYICLANNDQFQHQLRSRTLENMDWSPEFEQENLDKNPQRNAIMALRWCFHLKNIRLIFEILKGLNPSALNVVKAQLSDELNDQSIKPEYRQSLANLFEPEVRSYVFAPVPLLNYAIAPPPYLKNLQPLQPMKRRRIPVNKARKQSQKTRHPDPY